MKRTITILTTTVILLSTASPAISNSVSADVQTQPNQTSDAKTRVKRAYQGYSGGSNFGPDQYSMSYGGTTFPAQGYCPSGSKDLGYIGGGEHMCKRT